MHRNIFNLYIIKASKWFMLVMPIVVLFYNQNGLNQFQVFIVQAIYSISIVLLEIPSGYFADVLGRRKTIIIGSVFGFIGFFTYSISFNFYGFILAEIILGIGQSMISGADSAILYDTLASQNRKDEYTRFEGKISAIGNFAEALAGIIGGLLAVYSLRYPYYIQTIIMFFSIPAAFALIEPPQTTTLHKAGWKQIKYILTHALIENKTLRFNILFSSVTGAATLTMAWFVQPYFKLVNLPLVWYGTAWTVLNLMVGLISWFAHHIEMKYKQKYILLFITLSLACNCIFTGLFSTYVGLFFIGIFYMTRGLATPILKEYINRSTPSHIRATVLSIRNFMIRLVFAGVGPLLGYLTDRISLSLALVISGAMFLSFGIFSWILFRKEIEYKKDTL